MSAPAKSDTHVLYRFYDAEGALLYIGITNNPPARFRQHRGAKSWWDAVANIKLETFDSRRALEVAERGAIKSEKPKYNIAMNRPSTKSRNRPSPRSRVCSSCQIGLGRDYRGQYCGPCVEDGREFDSWVKGYHQFERDPDETNVPDHIYMAEMGRRLRLYWRYRDQIEEAERDRAHAAGYEGAMSMTEVDR